ncbi:MAG: N-acetylneuraminate synthase family protein [Alphaproteobacteria bacterium]|jgi:sialic acid synthase SpsE
MAQVVLRDGTVIKDYAVPYIIAEINSSHNGRVETARKMIETAKEIGVSCVKFQSWSADSLYSESYYAGNPIARRIVQKFSLNEEQLGELADYCAEIGISFSSTPYSRREVDFLLERCRAPFIKIASMDINNPEYLKYIAGTGAPIILSTGMAETAEVERAVKTLEDAGNPNIILLHCISIYPAAPSTIHLNNIAGLREAFPGCPVGFSDHTLGIETACAATALGAAVIEKHFTLDKTKMGMDNNMATEPDEFARMIQCCRNVHEALGSKERIVSEAEYEQRKKMRRSVIAARDLKAGQTLSPADLDVKRPGTGIPADRLESLVGRTLTRDIKADTLLADTDFR